MAADGPTESDGIATGRLRRAAPLARLAARTTGEAVIDSLRHRQPDPETYARRAERYVEVLGHSKGALMKAGQMLSTIPMGTSVPPENRAAFQAAMARLQADAPPMAPELVADMIRSELGAPPEEVFAVFSSTPLAAASIGQVHLARLHDGRAVAVKVQYPGVADAIRADLRNTELVAVFMQLLLSIVPRLSRADPKGMAAEISERIVEEMDYTLDAANQKFFADAYLGHPFIHIPDVVTEFSSARVLTQELAEGLGWADAVLAEQELRNSWGEVIYRFAHQSMQRLGAFNTDPHPGNYVFHTDGTVTFLDFGSVKRFSPERVRRLRTSFQSAMSRDAQAFWQSAVDGGGLDPATGPSPEELAGYYQVRDELHYGPQPVQWSPELMARLMEHEYSLRGPAGKVARSAHLPPDLVFFLRVDLGVMSIMAELRTIGDARAIMDELYEDASPGTPLGILDTEFWTAKATSQ
jgi:predicted unusual protein kinase regulating ubiquinone biosynthesis (AarF/ABC1/UbiB family)